MEGSSSVAHPNILLSPFPLPQELVADMYMEGSWGIRLDFRAELFQASDEISDDWRWW
jgi:hypothetical protein